MVLAKQFACPLTPTALVAGTHGPEAKELQGKPLRQLLDFLGTKPPGLCSSPPGAALQPLPVPGGCRSSSPSEPCSSRGAVTARGSGGQA